MLKIKNLLLFSLFFGFAFVSGLKAQSPLERIENAKIKNFHEIKSAIEKEYKDIPISERKGWKQYKRWEWFWEPRVSANGEFPRIGQIYKDYQKYEFKQKKDAIQAEAEWKQLGPFGEPALNVLGAQGIGRVNVVRFVKNQPDVMWAGTAGGGVWKSTDLGKNWKKMQYPQFMSLGVSDIAISPTNPNIIYVTTGDADGAGATSVQVNSIGIIKSTDGGQTWFQTGLEQNLSSGRVLARCLVHPENPDIAYVAASDGIYKTTNGGQSWTSKTSNSIIDMEFNPEDTDIMYASTRKWNTNEILKSSDGGESWKSVRTIGSSRRIAIAVTPDNSNIVYALVANTSRSFHSFLQSTDNGDTWVEKAKFGSSPNILGRDNGTDNAGQGEYDLALAASPYNHRLVFVGGINIWKSNDAGSSWNLSSHWYGGYSQPFVHADHHDIVFDDETGILASAHDGGIDISYNEGKTWIEASHGMSIMQFYRFSNSATNPNMIIAGSQDNGTNMFNNNRWQNTYGGDGMECIINPVDATRIYVSLYNGEIKRSINGGINFVDMIDFDRTGEYGAWVTPYVISEQDPSVLYAGYRNVFKLTKHGVEITKISNLANNQNLTSIAVAPSDVNTVYAATYSKLWATYNGGAEWVEIKNAPPSISYITVHPQNPRKIWITSSNYSSSGKVFEYDGTSMKNISGNLPNIAANSIVYQKNSPDRLYIGTDVGVFYSDNGSNTWIKFGSGLPNLVVTELEIQYAVNKLRAATYGGGVWEIELNLCDLKPPVLSISSDQVICPGDSVILSIDGNYSSVNWSNGEKSMTITIRETGTYYATVTDEKGCVAVTQPINVSFYTTPKLTIKPTSGMPLCEGDEIDVTLTATTILYNSWTWSTGDTGSSIKVNQAGNYSVIGITKDGCIIQSEVYELKASPKPEQPLVIWANHNTLMTSEAYYSYQWFLDGKKLIGATQRFYTIADSGMHSVEVSNEAGCKSLSKDFIVISSVDDDFINGMAIYPNPVSSLLNISFNLEEQSNVEIVIFDLLGQEIVTEKLLNLSGKNIHTMDLSRISKGTYFIQIIAGTSSKLERIILD